MTKKPVVTERDKAVLLYVQSRNSVPKPIEAACETYESLWERHYLEAVFFVNDDNSYVEGYRISELGKQVLQD